MTMSSSKAHFLDLICAGSFFSVNIWVEDLRDHRTVVIAKESQFQYC